jgi:hypothetical protein
MILLHREFLKDMWTPLCCDPPPIPLKKKKTTTKALTGMH